jgi:hypothetical protein
MDSFADDLVNLRFMPGPLQSLYLNQDRVNERFNSHLGAITTWTRSVDDAAFGPGGDRTYFVESGFDSMRELAMLVVDYRRQAERLGCIPMSRAALRRLVELDALADALS